MNTIFLLLIVGIIFLVLGYIVAKISEKRQNKIEIDAIKANYAQQERLFEHIIAENKNKITELETKNQQIQNAYHELDIAIHKKDTEFDLLLEQFKNKETEVLKLQEQFKAQFEVLAQQILDEKSMKFTEINEQKIKAILSPLNEKIQHFENKVIENQRVSTDYHGQLKAQIENLHKVSLKMNEETLNLTRALKSESKTQGNWGELILEKVLEKSGLEKGREYDTQAHFVTENNKHVYPDVVVYLPDGKSMIIDSKVSLTAYERYVNETNETLQQDFLKQHVQSINQHVETLSAKRYQDLLQDKSPDFVLLFMPIESAFASALNEQHNLYTKAFDKGIIIVTPTTLLATLRTIDSMWTNQKQQENALVIAKEAGALYDKFAGLLADLNNIGAKIKGLDKDYNLTINKLSEGNGNLIKRVERLKDLGAKTNKNLPEITPNRLL
ncbi:DNA recombination protein RmuC [Flavobacterium agricola]|uniref:DNA recombination protein RmuC n=1 Tax=Flavobacterium agricola TaxID=2870839 RepID=A0ABY6M038_9FLAO|nr:DNA recombination protein RmuC [Flavobacterium agricola]UYW00486.1 DNA recombination protein RmuC [Flavobacterium agricola]